MSTSDELAVRLADGWAKIGHAIESGQGVPQWEAFWIELLREYERACDAEDLAWETAPRVQAGMDLGVRKAEVA